MISYTAKVFAILAVAAFSTAFILDRHLAIHFDGVNFEPVNAPIQIIDKYQFSKSFTVDYQANYDISIQCNRLMSFGQLESLLRTELEGSCTVYEDGKKIFTFDFNDSWYGESSTDATLARLSPGFPASPSKTYRIELFIKKTVPELAPTRPTLIVGMDRITWKTQFYAPGMLFSLARLTSRSLGLLFLVVTLIVQVNHWMKNRTSAHDERRG